MKLTGTVASNTQSLLFVVTFVKKTRTKRLKKLICRREFARCFASEDRQFSYVKTNQKSIDQQEFV